MKKNPLLVALSIMAVFIILLLAAIGAAVYTAFGEKVPAVTSQSVLVLEVKGVITESRTFIKTMQKYRDDKDVKAIVVHLDSPGGVVGPSQEIYDEILKTRHMGKHVVASFGSMAASGAYYIAAACEKIVTEPGTITGSIGVIMEFANLSGLYNWVRVERYVVKSGPYKDIGSEARAMTAPEKEIIQSMIDNVYGQFKRAVAKGRNLKLEQVAELADGRIFSGEQAVKNGLADELGGLDDAVELAGKLSGFKGKAEMLMPPSHHKKIWDIFSPGESEDDDDLFGTVAKRVLGLRYAGLPLFMMPGARF
jgi:protease-4